MTKPGKFYFTKYALTIDLDKGGVSCFSATVNEGWGYAEKAEYAAATGSGSRGMYCRIGVDAFRSEEDAKANARLKAERKVRALRKQIAKIEAVFGGVD
jgi:hypothetical protein